MDSPNWSKMVIFISTFSSLAHCLQIKPIDAKSLSIPSGESSTSIIRQKAESFALELEKVASQFKDLSFRISKFALDLNPVENRKDECDRDQSQTNHVGNGDGHPAKGRAFYTRLRGISLSYVVNLLIQMIGLGSAIHWIIFFIQEFKKSQLPKLRKLCSALHQEVSFDPSFDYMVDFLDVYNINFD